MEKKLKNIFRNKDKEEKTNVDYERTYEELNTTSFKKCLKNLTNNYKVKRNPKS